MSTSIRSRALRLAVLPLVAATMLTGVVSASGYSISSGNAYYDGVAWKTLLPAQTVNLSGTSVYRTTPRHYEPSFASDYRRYRTLQPTASIIRVDRNNVAANTTSTGTAVANYGSTTVFGNYIANYAGTVQLSANN